MLSEHQNRVLVIDDEPEFYSLFFEYTGWLSTFADSVETARRKIEQEGNTFDLILLDLHLKSTLDAEPDGFDLLKEIKNNNAVANIPVVVVTKDDRWEFLSLVLDMGGDGFLFKTKYDPGIWHSELNAVRNGFKKNDELDYSLRNIYPDYANSLKEIKNFIDNGKGVLTLLGLAGTGKRQLLQDALGNSTLETMVNFAALKNTSEVEFQGLTQQYAAQPDQLFLFENIEVASVEDQSKLLDFIKNGARCILVMQERDVYIQNRLPYYVKTHSEYLRPNLFGMSDEDRKRLIFSFLEHTTICFSHQEPMLRQWGNERITNEALEAVLSYKFWQYHFREMKQMLQIGLARAILANRDSIDLCDLSDRFHIVLNDGGEGVQGKIPTFTPRQQEVYNQLQEWERKIREVDGKKESFYKEIGMVSTRFMSKIKDFYIEFPELFTPEIAPTLCHTFEFYFFEQRTILIIVWHPQHEIKGKEILYQMLKASKKEDALKSYAFWSCHFGSHDDSYEAKELEILRRVDLANRFYILVSSELLEDYNEKLTGKILNKLNEYQYHKGKHPFMVSLMEDLDLSVSEIFTSDNSIIITPHTVQDPEKMAVSLKASLI